MAHIAVLLDLLIISGVHKMSRIITIVVILSIGYVIGRIWTKPAQIVGLP